VPQVDPHSLQRAMSPKWASDYSLKGDGPTARSQRCMHDERCKRLRNSNMNSMFKNRSMAFGPNSREAGLITKLGIGGDIQSLQLGCD